MTHHYRTKYRLDTAVAIIFIFLGVCVISLVFGMLLFPIFTHVCANELLIGVARIGYGGVATLCIGLLLEAYNLYSEHKRHIAVIVAMTVLIAVVTSMMIHYGAAAYTCLNI